MVDTVLYFEGDRRQSFRLIRAINGKGRKKTRKKGLKSP